MPNKKGFTYLECLIEAVNKEAGKEENLSEYDTTDTVDIKGPMLDPILSFRGGGELPTSKDATTVAKVLEDFYFGEEKPIETLSNIDEQDAGGDVENPDPNNAEIKKIKDKAEDAIKSVDGEGMEGTGEIKIKEQDEEASDEEVEDKKDEEGMKEDLELAEMEDKDEDKDDDEDDEKMSEGSIEEIEGFSDSIIQKLIEEMEEEGEKLSEERAAGDRGETGEEEAAGTGTAEKDIPPRKDITKEQEDEEKKLDIDKEVDGTDSEKDLEEGADGAIPKSRAQGDGEEPEDLDEIFNSFREQIENDDDDDDDEVADLDSEKDIVV